MTGRWSDRFFCIICLRVIKLKHIFPMKVLKCCTTHIFTWYMKLEKRNLHINTWCNVKLNVCKYCKYWKGYYVGNDRKPYFQNYSNLYMEGRTSTCFKAVKESYFILFVTCIKVDIDKRTCLWLMWNNKVIILLTMDKIDVKQLFVECRVDAPPAFFLLNVEFLNKKQECIVIGFFFIWGQLIWGLFIWGQLICGLFIWSLFIEFLWGHHFSRLSYTLIFYCLF